MPQNPKIEFYKIHLKSTKEDHLTFREIFEHIYKSGNEDVDINDVTDEDLLNEFYQYFFNTIDEKFMNDERRKKAFYSKSEEVNGQPMNPISLNSAHHLIHGLIKGGPYDTGKDLGAINNPENETETLDKDKILLDTFYFLLHTPLDKDTGILVLQSYTKDYIADIFRPFIAKLFKLKGFSFKAIVSEFMPKKMQDSFKEHCVIKSLKFSNRMVVNDMQDGVLLDGEFTFDVIIKSRNNQVNLDNLPLWKRKLGNAILGIPNKPERKLDTFNKKKGYLQSTDKKSTPTPFILDSEELDIKATIYLQNYINLEENGIPKWEELKSFALTVLNDFIKPEVFPEDYLHED